MHPHLSKSRKEIEWVKALFPKRKGYLDVYDHYRLTGPTVMVCHSIARL